MLYCCSYATIVIKLCIGGINMFYKIGEPVYKDIPTAIWLEMGKDGTVYVTRRIPGKATQTILTLKGNTFSRPIIYDTDSPYPHRLDERND